MCIFMARTLSPRDIEILKRMVPELDIDISRPLFRSIFPPVGKHFCSSALEFGSRLDRLVSGDLEYLVGLIFSGEECLNCLQPEYTDVLIKKIRTDISPGKADDLIELLGFIKLE